MKTTLARLDGFVKISAQKIKMRLHAIVRYIGKYIGKDQEYEVLEFRKSFTTSQIKQIYKLSMPKLFEVIGRFGKEQAELFKCTYRKVFEVFRLDPFPVTKKLIMEFPSEWVYEGVDEVSF